MHMKQRSVKTNHRQMILIRSKWFKCCWKFCDKRSYQINKINKNNEIKRYVEGRNGNGAEGESEAIEII